MMNENRDFSELNEIWRDMIAHLEKDPNAINFFEGKHSCSKNAKMLTETYNIIITYISVIQNICITNKSLRK